MAWYKSRSSAAANKLVGELDSLFERIASAPLQFPITDHGARRAILRRFPLIVVFREAVEGIDIVALAHAKRKPGYWRARL